MARAAPLVLAVLLLLPGATAEPLRLREPVVVLAAAVAETTNGFVGSTATITITSADNGSGHVFLDTFPLAAVDMQGSARLAARVAAQLSGQDVAKHDFFFVIRSGAEQIGGPSAGAAMTVGAIASLQGWSVRSDVIMTGTISPDATVGPVGGIIEKAAAAANVGMSRFLFPAGQDVYPSGGQFVNVTEHCRTALRIECIPIADVVDAVGLMTDHALMRPPVVGNVTGEDFAKRLAPLSEILVRDAGVLIGEATAAHADLPEGAARSALGERLRESGVLLDKARNDSANGTYYRAASISFQSSIASHYVREASQYVAAQDRPAAIAGTLARARDAIARATIRVGDSPVRDTNTFESVGAAQVRILDAEERLTAATQLASNLTAPQAAFDALYQAAYAAERAHTAEWWLLLSEGFPAGQPVEKDALAQIARDTITMSKEEVAYVDAVFQSAGGQPLMRSRELLADAESAMTRGYYAGAMLSALEASVRASVILEVAGYGGTVPEAKFETARDGAGRAIQGARSRGVESLLAQSAYEFGITLEDPQERLAFLGLARVTGNLAGLPGLFHDSGPALESRFQGEPFFFRVNVVYVAAAFAVGLALGAGAGLTALMPRKDEDEDLAAPADRYAP